MHVCHPLVLLIPWDVGGSKSNGLSDEVPLPSRRHHPQNRSAIYGKTKDLGDVLQRHRDLTRWKVERVGLWTPPVHECHQRGDAHQWQTAVDEPSKRQEPRTMYEQLIPLVLVQGAVRVDPEWLQTLSNTTTVKKY
jgi:hypothetical protein